MATILGSENGPWTIVYPNSGSITAFDAESAQTYCTPTDWTDFQTSLQPTFVTWTQTLTDFQATTPTVGQLNTWLAAHPPSPD